MKVIKFILDPEVKSAVESQQEALINETILLRQDVLEVSDIQAAETTIESLSRADSIRDGAVLILDDAAINEMRVGATANLIQKAYSGRGVKTKIITRDKSMWEHSAITGINQRAFEMLSIEQAGKVFDR